MSDEIKRYHNFKSGFMHLQPDGQYVDFADYAAREADHAAIVERLTREVAVWKSKVEFLVPAARREGAEAMREMAARKLRDCVAVDTRLDGCHPQQVVSIGVRVDGQIVATYRDHADFIVDAMVSILRSLELPK